MPATALPRIRLVMRSPPEEANSAMRTGNTTHEFVMDTVYANWGYAVPYRGILVLS